MSKLKKTPRIIIGALIIAIAGVAYCLIYLRGADGLRVVPVTSERPGQGDQKIAHFTDTEVGLQFDYRTSPNGYVVLDRDIAGDFSDAPLKELSLFLKTDYEELLRDEGLPREGPPNINIQVFNPGPNITPNEWVAQHPDWLTNFQTGTPITWETIDGNAAARYSWAGLYQGQTVVIARKGWVFMFTLSYFDSSMLEDFNGLLMTLQLQR